MIRGLLRTLVALHPHWRARLSVCRDRILSAVSTDGRIWVHDRGVRINVAPDHPSIEMAYYCSVLTPAETGTDFEMIYQGSTLDDGQWRSHLIAASSPDGLRWIDRASVLTQGGADLFAKRVMAPTLLRIPCGWRLYFAGVGGDGVTRILSARSDDRRTWTMEEGSRLEPLQFAVASDSTVTHVCDPCIVTLDGGGYRMYLAVHRPSHYFQEIWCAHSADGLNWSPECPCLLPGRNGMRHIVNNPHVVAADNGWRMYFRGCDHLPLWSSIYSAFSKDGKSWSIEGLALAYRHWHPHEMHGVGFPHVIRTSDGHWRMYYTGYWGNLYDTSVLHYYREEHRRVFGTQES